MHILAFEKELSCHLYTFEGQFHIIYSFGKRPHAIFDMGTFSKMLLMLPIPKYAYVERNFLLLIHTLQGIFMPYIHTLCKVFPRHLYSHIYIPLKGIFHATYIHTYMHTIERYFPCYLGAKYSSWGSQILVKTFQVCPNIHAFSHSKPKFRFLGIIHAALH